MNKAFFQNGKLYPGCLESRSQNLNEACPSRTTHAGLQETALPPSVTGPAVDTHAHVFRQGLALADTRRHPPDYDATPAQ